MLFGKWELVEEGKHMVNHEYNPCTGYSNTYPVIVDVYRKKRLNGMYKYKNVIRR